MMTKERSTKIVNYMTPRVGGVTMMYILDNIYQYTAH